MSKLIKTIIIISILSIGTITAWVIYRFPVQHLDIVRANANNIDPAVIMAVIRAESSFRPRAVSSQGARGLMQIMPTTGYWLAELMEKDDFHLDDLWDPEINIAMGSFYLNWLLDFFDGNLDLAITAYNAGPGNVGRWLVHFSYDGENLNSIPFMETYIYSHRVTANTRVYRILLLFQ